MWPAVKEQSVSIMVLLGLLFFFALASAEEVAVQKSLLDVFAFNSYYNSQSYSNPDLYQSPVIVLTQNEKSDGLVAYYADNGLRSVADYHNFEPLYQFLQGQSHISALLLSHKEFYDNSFFGRSVSSFVLPDSLKVSDLLREVQVRSVPVLYVATKQVFNSHHFVGLKHTFRFAVSEANVEPVHGSFDSFNAQPSRFQFFNFQNFGGLPSNFHNYGSYPFLYYKYHQIANQGYGKSPTTDQGTGNYGPKYNHFYAYYPPNGQTRYSTSNNNKNAFIGNNPSFNQ